MEKQVIELEIKFLEKESWNSKIVNRIRRETIKMVWLCKDN
jgi:hypothetical protein